MTRCAILVQKRTLCRVFSGLVQSCQPPKGEKCEILNLELGKIVQAINYGAKQGSWLILILKDYNYKPHFGTLWVKKDDEGKDRSFFFLWSVH